MARLAAGPTPVANDPRADIHRPAVQTAAFPLTPNIAGVAPKNSGMDSMLRCAGRSTFPQRFGECYRGQFAELSLVIGGEPTEMAEAKP